MGLLNCLEICGVTRPTNTLKQLTFTVHLRLAMFIEIKQNSVGSLTQVALLFLNLCQKEGGLAQVPFSSQGIKPHISFAMVPVSGDMSCILL